MIEADSEELDRFERDLRRLDELRGVIERHRNAEFSAEEYAVRGRRFATIAVVALAVVAILLIGFGLRLAREAQDVDAQQKALEYEKLALSNRERYFDAHHLGVRLETDLGTRFFAFPSAIGIWKRKCSSGHWCATPVYQK